MPPLLPVAVIPLTHYGDVLVGSIAIRAGVPVDADQWGWSISFETRVERVSGASRQVKVL